jgi:hypothetical protein
MAEALGVQNEPFWNGYESLGLRGLDSYNSRMGMAMRNRRLGWPVADVDRVIESVVAACGARDET